MTAWAVAILHGPRTWPMFATAPRSIGALTVLPGVERHPPDFQSGVVHRGVTLYAPRRAADGGRRTSCATFARRVPPAR